MTELMEESLHLTEGEQCRLISSRLGEIHHQTDVRTYVFALLVNPLILITGHPSSTLLALSRIEIGIEDCEI